MNKNLKPQILELRKLGYSYGKIQEKLSCSRSTISYHVGPGQKKKSKDRAALRRNNFNKHQNTVRTYLREFCWRYKKMCTCKHCGEGNPLVLQFDHLDPTTKVTTVAEMLSSRYNIKLIKEEIRKCQVLCANCHILKTAKDLNYLTF